MISAKNSKPRSYCRILNNRYIDVNIRWFEITLRRKQKKNIAKKNLINNGKI